MFMLTCYVVVIVIICVCYYLCCYEVNKTQKVLNNKDRFTNGVLPTSINKMRDEFIIRQKASNNTF